MNAVFEAPLLAPAQGSVPDAADPPTVFVGNIHDAQNHFALSAFRVSFVLSVLESGEFPLWPIRCARCQRFLSPSPLPR